MEVVLKHTGTAAWASEVEYVSPDLSQLHSTGPVDAPVDTIRTSSIKPAQCRTHVDGREYEGLVVFREFSLDGHLPVVPVKAAIEVVELIR